MEVLTEIPGATGVVQEAGRPLRPSISIRHRRQEPKDFTLSVAQSLGSRRQLHRRAHDRRALGDADLLAVDLQESPAFGLGGRRSVIDFLDERHKLRSLFIRLRAAGDAILSGRPLRHGRRS